MDLHAVTDVIQVMPEAVKETKAGYKTTEFWTTIASVLCALLAGLPEKYSALVLLGATGSYALSRGIAKHGQPHIEVPPI
jgi:hypothetical protein